MLRCNSCGGTYPDTSDGSTPAYAHACPTEIFDQHSVCDEKTGEAIKPATFKPTPNPRNENIVAYEETNEQGQVVRKYRMISEGSGVTKVE
jgi:hypothetical protein